METGKGRKPGGQAEISRRLREESRTLQRQGRGEIESDILGSYTGTPEDGEVPEQDADDL